jgi:hypothetical protein
VRSPAKIVGSLKLSAVVLVALATFAQAAQFAHHPPLTPGDGLEGVAAKSATPGFKVNGHISGLYPGEKAKLVTRVHNPNGFAITVRSLKVSVGNVPGCSGKNIEIKKFKGKHRVPAHRTGKIKLQLTMKPKAPDACQAAKLTLAYHGKAVKA